VAIINNSAKAKSLGRGWALGCFGWVWLVLGGFAYLSGFCLFWVFFWVFCSESGLAFKGLKVSAKFRVCLLYQAVSYKV